MMKPKSQHPSFITEILIGFCVGTANIIPGVSGGTFLLIFKIYERIFSVLNHINKASIIEFSVFVFKIVFQSGKADSLKILFDFLRKNDFIFLFRLIVGALIAIFFLSSLMKYLMIHHFSATYALFFGLILISIIIPVKMLRDRKAYLILFVIIGAVLTIYVTVAVNPYEKVKVKSESYKNQYFSAQGLQQGKSDISAFPFIGKYTSNEYIYALICGAVAVSAMILPGISGSLVLILMGEYFEVIAAISGLKTLNLENVAFLGCFAMGIIFGGLFFAKLINMVLKRYYNATMAFLTGLMAGSLYALWPFKKSIIMAQQYIKENGVICIAQNVRVYTNINKLPDIGFHLYVALVTFLIGCIIMFFFIGKESPK